MLTEDGKHLYVSHEDYNQAIEKLALKVHSSGWQFDNILCLARGGLRIGDIFSRLFKMPLAIMSSSSYRAEGGTIQGKIDIGKYISTPYGGVGGKVLLLDDMADTGVTLAKVVEMLKSQYPQITELKTAVLWKKSISVFEPDFMVEELPTNPWIHQPFESYDRVTIDDLIKKWHI